MLPNRAVRVLCLLVSWAVCQPLGAADERTEEQWAIISKATYASAKNDYAAAVAILDGAIAAGDTRDDTYGRRGEARLYAGDLTGALEDFDRGEKQNEARRVGRSDAHGIAYYYAGRFLEGAYAFDAGKNDLAAAMWHYACVARQFDVHAARRSLPFVENSFGIPVMELYSLYQGKLKPADVLKASEAIVPEYEYRADRLFESHFYIALWYEAHGERKECKQYLTTAIEKYSHPRLKKIAEAHLVLLKKEEEKAAAAAQKAQQAKPGNVKKEQPLAK